MKNEIKSFPNKHLVSIIILKLVNDSLRVWKKKSECQIVPVPDCCINIGHDHILVLDDGKNDDDQGEVTKGA